MKELTDWLRPIRITGLLAAVALMVAACQGGGGDPTPAAEVEPTPQANKAAPTVSPVSKA